MARVSVTRHAIHTSPATNEAQREVPELTVPAPVVSEAGIHRTLVQQQTQGRAVALATRKVHG